MTMDARTALIERIAEAWYAEDPTWNTAPARRELADTARRAVVEWLLSEGPSALAEHLPGSYRPSDNLVYLGALADALVAGGDGRVGSDDV